MCCRKRKARRLRERFRRPLRGPQPLEVDSRVFRPRRALFLGATLFAPPSRSLMSTKSASSPQRKNFAKQSRRAVVGIDVGQDVISRRERVKQRHCRGHAAAKSGCRLAAFERADAFSNALRFGLLLRVYMNRANKLLRYRARRWWTGESVPRPLRWRDRSHVRHGRLEFPRELYQFS